MKNIGWIILIAVLAACNSNSNSGSFFSEMPHKFKTDSLTFNPDLFANLEIEDIKLPKQDMIQLAFKQPFNGCNLIPFCGYLSYKTDTIYHSETINGTKRPFLVLNAKRLSSWTLDYRPERTDDITYMGFMGQPGQKDGIHLFMFIPKGRSQADSTYYLRYLAIKKGGIKFLSFSNGKELQIVRFDERPKVIDKTLE